MTSYHRLQNEETALQDSIPVRDTIPLQDMTSRQDESSKAALQTAHSRISPILEETTSSVEICANWLREVEAVRNTGILGEEGNRLPLIPHPSI